MSVLAGTLDAASAAGQFLSTVPPITGALTTLCPIFTVYKIYKTKSTGCLSAMPYLSMIINCFAWAMYGVVTESAPIMATYFLGTMLGIFYTTVYHWYAEQPQLLCKYYLAVAVVSALTFGVAFMDNAVQVLGIIASLLYFLFLMSPLLSLGHVVKTKSVETLPFDMAFSILINCILWTAYGWLVVDDFTVVLTSAVGVALSSVQLFCHVLYGDVKQSSLDFFCCCFATGKVIDPMPEITEKKLETPEDTPVDLEQPPEVSLDVDGLVIEPTPIGPTLAIV